MWYRSSRLGRRKKKIVKIQTIGSYTQYPLKPAYAVTVHKSQGMTYDKVNVQGRIESFFTTGQLYVALSRCRNLKTLFLNLGLTADKEEKICLADPEVLKFYTEIVEKNDEITICNTNFSNNELYTNSPPNSNKIPKKSTETISTKPKKNKDNKTKFVSFRLNKKYHSYLEQICEELRISKTIFFSTLLEN